MSSQPTKPTFGGNRGWPQPPTKGWTRESIELYLKDTSYSRINECHRLRSPSSSLSPWDDTWITSSCSPDEPNTVKPALSPSSDTPDTSDTYAWAVVPESKRLDTRGIWKNAVLMEPMKTGLKNSPYGNYREPFDIYGWDKYMHDFAREKVYERIPDASMEKYANVNENVRIYTEGIIWGACVSWLAWNPGVAEERTDQTSLLLRLLPCLGRIPNPPSRNPNHIPQQTQAILNPKVESSSSQTKSSLSPPLVTGNPSLEITPELSTRVSPLALNPAAVPFISAENAMANPTTESSSTAVSKNDDQSTVVQLNSEPKLLWSQVAARSPVTSQNRAVSDSRNISNLGQLSANSNKPQSTDNPKAASHSGNTPNIDQPNVDSDCPQAAVNSRTAVSEHQDNEPVVRPPQIPLLLEGADPDTKAHLIKDPWFNPQPRKYIHRRPFLEMIKELSDMKIARERAASAQTVTVPSSSEPAPPPEPLARETSPSTQPSLAQSSGEPSPPIETPASASRNTSCSSSVGAQKEDLPKEDLPKKGSKESQPTVQKIVSEILPASSGLAFGKDARDLLIECCVEFITLISSEANEISEKESKKTIACEHITKALEQLGFGEYVQDIMEVASEHKEQLKGREKKANKLEQSGLSTEELLAMQEEAFRDAAQRHG